ncbi:MULTISPECIES: hypothetical protein [unclassified Bradyrhizobium]|uniref:hypothetical protein n=1 Tax=unclassified Bradyrhizobium TaxID=2631580 RepID=UPI001FFB357D|nr:MULTISPECIES: hypothetical protein [unclassified Bradyrhizobium]MCK1709080.1 hypothetical protein [Bradyrhizobium sp. 143]MCK1732131.1 hypothetical protein [Bradyrhizobium sp. 142]
MPIVPPLFQGTKNTTLHELQTGDRSRATDRPLDVELQTPAATFTLVRILLASGEAFPEAADVIIPFIQPDDPRSQSTVHSIAEADEAFYKAAPSKMLDMLVAVVGDAPPGSVYALGKALSRLRTIAPALGDSRKFQKLLPLASQH